MGRWTGGTAGFHPDGTMGSAEQSCARNEVSSVHHADGTLFGKVLLQQFRKFQVQ
jgi:hypothetical protein